MAGKLVACAGSFACQLQRSPWRAAVFLCNGVLRNATVRMIVAWSGSGLAAFQRFERFADTLVTQRARAAQPTFDAQHAEWTEKSVDIMPSTSALVRMARGQ
jgi:hypothetical protein